MKIEDYEILRIEAKLCSFFIDKKIETKVSPEMRWRHFSGPYSMERNNANYFNPSLNTVLISKCSYYEPKTRPPYYQITIFITRTITKQIGSHLVLRDYIDPIARSMDCKAEVNYSKHSGSFNRVVLTLFKNENRRIL